MPGSPRRLPVGCVCREHAPDDGERLLQLWRRWRIARRRDELATTGRTARGVFPSPLVLGHVTRDAAHGARDEVGLVVGGIEIGDRGEHPAWARQLAPGALGCVASTHVVLGGKLCRERPTVDRRCRRVERPRFEQLADRKTRRQRRRRGSRSAIASRRDASSVPVASKSAGAVRPSRRGPPTVHASGGPFATNRALPRGGRGSPRPTPHVAAPGPRRSPPRERRCRRGAWRWHRTPRQPFDRRHALVALCFLAKGSRGAHCLAVRAHVRREDRRERHRCVRWRRAPHGRTQRLFGRSDRRARSDKRVDPRRIAPFVEGELRSVPLDRRQKSASHVARKP